MSEEAVTTEKNNIQFKPGSGLFQVLEQSSARRH